MHCLAWLLHFSYVRYIRLSVLAIPLLFGWLKQMTTPSSLLGTMLTRRLESVMSSCMGHHGKMEHMYSILAARSRPPPISLSRNRQFTDVMSLPWESFLPTHDDVWRVKENLVVLVSRMLTKYFKSLSPLSKAVPQPISHQHSEQMLKKSEVVMLNALMKNEAQGSDVLAHYLGTSGNTPEE